MKKSTRRRPELESLEAVVLMSTVVAEAHHAAPKAAVVAPSGPVPLSGTFALKSQNFPAVKGLIPATTGFVGSGSLGQFGRTGVLVENLGGATPGYIIALEGKSGYFALMADISLPAKGATTTATYDAIDGDGGPIDHANPTGTITISDVVSKGGKASYVLKLS